MNTSALVLWLSVVTVVGGCCFYFFYRVLTAVAKPDTDDVEGGAS